MSRNPALLRALDLAATPSLAFAVRQHALPDGVLELIKILAEEPTALESAVSQCNRNPRYIRAAAQYYVQQVLLYPGADCYRMLGVRPGATRQEMRTHMRWLMTWLHPDLAKDEWRSVFAGRVIEAWREAQAPVPKPRFPTQRVSHAHAALTTSRGSRNLLPQLPPRTMTRSRSVLTIGGLTVGMGLVLMVSEYAGLGLADNVKQWLASQTTAIIHQLSSR